MPKNFSQKGFTKNFLDLMKQEEINKECCLNFLIKIYTKNSTTVSFTGSGTEADPLSATAAGGTSFELETVGSSGPATFLGGILNIPDYSAASGSTTIPGGSDTQIQFNQAGVFGGVPGFAINYVSGLVTIDPISGVGSCLQLGDAAYTNCALGLVSQSSQAPGFQDWILEVDTTGFLRINESISGAQVANFGCLAGVPQFTSYGAIYPGQYSTTDKLALVVTAGAQVYDTDLNQMSYYNGTAWVNF